MTRRSFVEVVRYVRARDLEEKIRELVERLALTHIDPTCVRCVRSYGSKARKTYARVHSASKAYVTGLGIRPTYVIEFISENFDKLREDEKIKVMIHELLHIPKSFGGGLIGHGSFDFDKVVEELYSTLKSRHVRNIL